eukprot:15338256-Ditylum_brightwellii.AAC.2
MTHFLKATFPTLHLLANEDRNENFGHVIGKKINHPKVEFIQNNCIEGNASRLKNASCPGFASHIDGTNSKVQPGYQYMA